MGLSVTDWIQVIGTLVTLALVVFIAKQTSLLGRQTEALKTQTNLLQVEFDINFRPWIKLERRSESEPLEISIDLDKNTITPTFRFKNHGKLSTTSAQGVIDIDIEGKTDLAARGLQLVLPKAFAPEEVIIYSQPKKGADLIEKIKEKRYFHVGFFMKYFYIDRVKETTSYGQYYVLVRAEVDIADLGGAGKRAKTITTYIVHERSE